MARWEYGVKIDRSQLMRFDGQIWLWAAEKFRGQWNCQRIGKRQPRGILGRFRTARCDASLRELRQDAKMGPEAGW
jgi:hypothetical protein